MGVKSGRGFLYWRHKDVKGVQFEPPYPKSRLSTLVGTEPMHQLHVVVVIVVVQSKVG